MKFIATKICPKCGTRSESPIVNAAQLVDLLAPVAESVALVTMMGRGKAAAGLQMIDDYTCQTCQGKEITPGEMAGIERAYAPRPERPNVEYKVKQVPGFAPDAETMACGCPVGAHPPVGEIDA